MELLSISDLKDRLKISYTTLRAITQRPGFPKPIQLSPRKRVWIADEVTDWLKANLMPSQAKTDGEDA